MNNRERRIKLTGDAFGNEAVVFGDWENWRFYYRKYLDCGVLPELVNQYRQNYPDLIVRDLMSEISNSNLVYATLLRRGVNKWLFVRTLLIRYKKLVKEWYKEAEKKMQKANNEYAKAYWKGYRDAMFKVRADLKALCNTPRYVIWNGDRPGAVIDKKISRGWLMLVKKLFEVRFND